MKAIAIANCCVALLLTIVLSGVRPAKITEDLDAMAEGGGIINGIFKPSRNGSLGFSRFGSVYRGHLLPIDRTKIKVAMKFTPINKLEISEKEYAMYTYLGAIDDESAEKYGIPTIYYYGLWKKHTMLGMTLLDSQFQIEFKAGHFDELKLLIVFREFVKMIKYIHSRGIIHYDIRIDNMIILNSGRGFIFDFGSSFEMVNGASAKNIADAKDDFRYFLNSLFNCFDQLPDWQWFGIADDDRKEMKDVVTFVAKLLRDKKTKKRKSFTGARKVFLDFYKHAYDNRSTGITAANGTWIPFYDQLYEGVIEEIVQCGGEATSSNPPMSSIPDPFGSHVNHVPRPEVQCNWFERKYAEENKLGEKASRSSGSGTKYR